MNSNLVYAIHTVEARDWGPYMGCNIDPAHPNAPFHCEGARIPITVKDTATCGLQSNGLSRGLVPYESAG